MNTRFFLSSILTSLLTLPAAAQVLSDEIVVTASALPEEIESTPAAATVITRREIDLRAARDIADVLREVPGVTISRSGTPGRATSLFTRGSGSKHTLVLWNGIEITNPYFSGYDWGRFSTAGVDQVEVVRGPYSALYGSDAVAGVVNVLTNPRQSDFRASVEGGSRGLRNGNVAASWVSGNATISGAYESREDDGFAPNDDFSQDTANAFLRWGTDTFHIGLSARHTTFDLGIATNLNAAATELVPSLSRRQDGGETQIAIPIEQTLGRFSYDLTLAESRRDEDFEDPDDPFSLVSQTTESTTRRARLTTRTTTPIGTIVLGGEYETAEVDDVTNFGANLEGREREETSFFIEDRLTRELGATTRLELSAGVRYDDYETFGSELSPRVALALIAGANKFRAAYGDSFRAPSIGELYTPFFGNELLEAERSNSYEVGYDRALTAGQFSLTLFRGTYDDLIVYEFITQQFQNVGHAQSQGVELALEHDVTSRLRAGFSYTFLDTEDADTGRELARRPRHSGSLSAGYRAGNVLVHAVLQHTGARVDVLPVAPFASVQNEAFTTLDANVQYSLGNFTPYVKIENLTGEDHQEVLGYPSPERRVIAGVRFTR